jgi:hypothetical protein
MISRVAIAAAIQNKKECATRLLNRMRRYLLLPLAHYGGRDMVLLTNGQWLDASPSIQPEQIRWRYNVEAHTLVRQGAEGVRLVRWPWLSVATATRDLSDFFEGLRITAGHSLSDDKAVMLFAHQMGWFPAEDLYIIHRDGSEDTYVLDASGVHVRRSAGEAQESDVNFIR